MLPRKDVKWVKTLEGGTTEVVGLNDNGQVVARWELADFQNINGKASPGLLLRVTFLTILAVAVQS
jgi:hypothetical protein